MHTKKSDFFRLLVILIVFTVSILLVNENKRSNALITSLDVSHTTPDNIVHFAFDHVYEHMHSLLISRNISLIVQVISQCNVHYIYDLVEKIVTNHTLSLTNEEKIKIIFGVAAHCNGKKRLVYRLFDLLSLHPEIYTNAPVLLVLVRVKQFDILSTFVRWLDDNQEKNEKRKDLAHWLMIHSLEVAVAENDCTATEIILSKKIRIEKDTASSLLWYAVEHNKDVLFVRLFVLRAHADVNYSLDGKHTLLIRAVENNNIEIVRALVEEGAHVDQVIDISVGSAISIAQKYGYKEVVSLLV